MTSSGRNRMSESTNNSPSNFFERTTLVANMLRAVTMSAESIPCISHSMPARTSRFIRATSVQAVPHSGTAEAFACRLLLDIASAERDADKDRKWILDAFAECMLAITKPEARPKTYLPKKNPAHGGRGFISRCRQV